MGLSAGRDSRGMMILSLQSLHPVLCMRMYLALLSASWLDDKMRMKKGKLFVFGRGNPCHVCVGMMLTDWFYITANHCFECIVSFLVPSTRLLRDFIYLCNISVIMCLHHR